MIRRLAILTLVCFAVLAGGLAPHPVGVPVAFIFFDALIKIIR